MKKPNKSFYFIISIFLVCIIIVVTFLVLLDSNKVLELNERKELITTLVTVSEDDELVFTQAVLFDTYGKNILVVDVPLNISVYLPFEKKYGALNSFYNTKRQKEYREQVQKILGLEFEFYLDFELEQIAQLVDLTGGVNIVVLDPIDDRTGEDVYLIPPGDISLDGFKAEKFLKYEGFDDYSEASRRRYDFAVSFIKSMSAESAKLDKAGYLKKSWKHINTNFSYDSFVSYWALMDSLNFDRIGFRKILGEKITIENEVLINPHRNGELIKASIKQFVDSLADSDNIFAGETIVLEILNGTKINNLAFNTSQIYRSFGIYEVDSVANAESFNYEKTKIILRNGPVEYAKKVADIIGCKVIEEKPYDDVFKQNIHVTIILGTNFNGKTCN